MTTLFEKRTKFQTIKLVEHPLYKREYQLYLDGAWQFSTDVEFKYHECLVTLPMIVSPQIDKVLICGGGDGMALREALKFRDIDGATLCEIDPEMIALFSGPYVALNSSSFKHPKANIHIGDAISYARKQAEEGKKFDFIVLDFPSPSMSNRDKNYESLFSPKVWDEFLKLLPDWGVLSAQVSLTPEELAPLLRHLLRAGYLCWQYDVYYDERGGHDSFLTISKRWLERERPLPDGIRFVTDKHVEVGISNTTIIDHADLDYFRLFCHSEALDFEPKLGML